MRSTNRPYLYPVDHLRAFAALLVVLYHSTDVISVARRHTTGFDPSTDWPYSRNPLKTIVFEGHTGVALFMVLSGFIFTIGTLDREISYGRFIVNRLLRIYPLYLVVLFIAVAVHPRISFGLVAQVILPFSNFGGPIAFGGAWGAMFWAVAIEFQFYLLFPLLLLLLNKFGPSALLKIIASMIVLRVMAAFADSTIDINNLAYFSIVGRLDQFLLGMLIAWVYIRRPSWLNRGTMALSTVAAVLMLWVFNQLHGYAHPAGWRMIWVDVEGGVWALFIGSYVRTFRDRTGRLSRAIASIGAASFSIYLLHFVIVSDVAAGKHHLVINVGGPILTGFVTGVLVVVPIVLLVASITYQGIEKPFLALRVRYLVSRAAAPSTEELIADAGSR